MSRILVTSSPGLGHIHPMMPLARALAARGHDVRWAVAASVCPRVQAVGFDAFPAGMEARARHAEFGRRHPEITALPPEEQPDLMFAGLFGEVAAPAMLADLLPVFEEWRPALVVNDASDLAGPIAARRAGIPHVTHGFGALLPEVRVARAGEVVADLWRAAGLDPRPYGGLYDHLYLDIYPPSMRAPGGRDHVPRVEDVRPVPFDAVTGDDEVHAVAAPSGRPLVYLTFGTLFNDVQGIFSASVTAVAGLDVDVVVTVGPDGDPGALGPVGENVRVARYLPQTRLLPRCSAVVSHAGSGTVLAALGLGIPQVCLPQGADQFLNARLAAGVGAAVALMPDEASATSVAEAVRCVLEDPAIAAASRHVADDIAAMPSPDEVAAALEALL